MADMQQPVDFDTRPPVPVSEYERTVKAVNMGYDLLFTLTHAFLRALHQPALHLLVVGAGGGAEIEHFLPDNPGWRITGVDPSEDMLALARAKAAHLGVSDRVTLVRGTVENLPRETCFDAATCLFVLHFLPDAGKLALLRDIAGQLCPDAPVLVATASAGGGFARRLPRHLAATRGTYGPARRADGGEDRTAAANAADAERPGGLRASAARGRIPPR